MSFIATFFLFMVLVFDAKWTASNIGQIECYSVKLYGSSRGRNRVHVCLLKLHV